MSGFRRVVYGVLGTLLVAVTLSTGPVTAGAVVDPNVQPFLVQHGIVASVDPVLPGLSIRCSDATANPPWMVDGTQPTCANDQVSILVSPSTRYFSQVHADGSPCPAGGADCYYRNATFAETVSVDASLRVGGYWARVNYQQYRFEATYIWNPGTNVSDPPPNPQPSTPQDYTYSRRYVVDASVREIGTGLLSGGTLWSDKWGMVVGDIPTAINPSTNKDGYFSDDHVKAIAAAHRNPQTLDPQIPITTNDLYPVSTATFLPPQTRYWVQHADGKFWPSTKDQTVTPGAALRVAGAYGWADADWRFLAYFVWRPAPGALPGRYLFNVDESTRPAGAAAGDTSVPANYTGRSLTGDGQVNNAGATFNTSWSFDSQSGRWVVTGDFRFTKCVMPDGTTACGERGTLSGNLSGSWDPATNQLALSLVSSSASSSNGIFCGVTVAGTMTGTNLPDFSTSPPRPPTTTLTGAVNLVANRDPTVTCS